MFAKHSEFDIKEVLIYFELNYNFVFKNDRPIPIPNIIKSEWMNIVKNSDIKHEKGNNLY